MIGKQDRASPIGNTGGSARQRRAARSGEYRAEQERLAPYEAIARMVIARRIRYALTQEQLAERMGTSVSAISRLESGQHRPNVETLEKLGQAFGERFVLGFEDAAGQRELAFVGRYVPDDLWVRDRVARRHARPAYAELPDEVRREGDRIREGPAGRVAEVYQTGYWLGLALSPGLPGAAFSVLESLGWDLQRFAEVEKGYEWPSVEGWDDDADHVFSFRESLERIAEDQGIDVTGKAWLRRGRLREGLMDALRDTWGGSAREPDMTRSTLGRLRLEGRWRSVGKDAPLSPAPKGGEAPKEKAEKSSHGS